MTDLELLSSLTNKEICSIILRGIIRFIPVDPYKYHNYDQYLGDLREKLKFAHVEDCDLAIASIDLVEDTEYAIHEFLENGLGEENKFHQVNFGQAYLRLYGILNAVYQQINAVREISTIFHLDNKNKRILELTEHQIYKIRNKIGSHTTSYMIDKKRVNNRENLDFFRVTRISLSKDGKDLAIVSQKGGVEKIDLKKIVRSYNKLAESILIDICKKSIYKIFPNKYENRDWLEFRLEFILNRNEKLKPAANKG